MLKMKLLITGGLQEDESFFNEIQSVGHSVVYVSDERIPLSAQNINPAQFEGVICNSLFLHTPIEQFPNLKFVQLTSAGYDRVPLDYMKENQIEIYNAKGVYSVPMAEFAIGGVLQIYKKSCCFYENRRCEKWEKQRNLIELAEKTVVIIGCGEVGRECAKRFSAFDCRVIGVNRTIRKEPFFESIVPITEMQNVLSYADIVVLTVALTKETVHIIGKEALRNMKTNAILVNISRGAVVDTSALIEWLEQNPCAGAALDVFEEEPLPTLSPLWSLENVIITPHNSFVSEKNKFRLMNVIRQNLKLDPIRG